jgi:transcriptional regulator with XRE-family HTH domain
MSKLPYVNMNKIRALTKEQGLSLTYFCNQFGKSRTYLSVIASGKDRLASEELTFIAEKLGVSEAYLLDETDDPAPTTKTAPPEEPEEPLSEVKRRLHALVDTADEDEVERMLVMMEALIEAERKKRETK